MLILLRDRSLTDRMTMKRLFLILISCIVAAGTADARKVTGCVRCGHDTLSGVVVTDGVNFTQTRKNGKFSFDINDDAEYVYIVTPSGYAADWSSGVPAFYQSAPGNSRFDFNLIRTGEGDDYHLLAIGDIQARDDNHFAIFAADPISDLKAIGNTFTKPVVGVTLGDVCWDRLQYFSKYKEHIVQVGFPVYPILGNHDHDRVTSGDIGASVTYRKEMGPVNYAFYVGKDIVIGLDNIIFNENRKYIEGYADHVIQWLSSLLKYVPQDADIYIAQHSPLTRWFLNKVIYNSEKILDLVRGHKVIFLSGHSHICNNIDIEKDIVEHNVAALCGTWWDTYHCNDGTPKGYKVYTKQDGKLQWYYKSIGKNKDYQMELYMPGQTVMHPNSIVLNIWDYDPAWKVEWAEDGRPMGSMEQVEDLSPVFIRELYEAYEGRIDQLKVRDYKFPRHNIHYFAATPSQYAEKVTITVESRFGKKWVYNVDMSGYVDVQAHRGGMGLMPENTIAAMKNALNLGVNTLELDLQLSKDGVVVVSHDAYFHHRYATRPDDTFVWKGEPKEYLYTMNYDQITKYDVGRKPNKDWPEKKCMPAVKPTLHELIDFVESYTKEMGYSPVRYNIEIKSSAADGEGVNWPEYKEFADVCVQALQSRGLGDRLVIQSFDTRALNYIHGRYPQLRLSYLTDKSDTDFDSFMAELEFIPDWLSPHHSVVDEDLVQKCHDKGMKIVPWTVDDSDELRRLIDLRVDAIITNYPDRLLKLTRGYAEPAPGPIPERTH